MERLIKVETQDDIFPQYINTPIGNLLEYQNMGKPQQAYNEAQILVGMCMDNRKHLNIPENFAYIIRTGGANLRYSEFKVSYAIAVGNIEYIALLAHNNCGMVNLVSRRQLFIDGLVNKAGWEKEWAEEHFMHFAPMFEIGNEIDFVTSEANRLRSRYPKITVAPMFYNVDDNKISLIKEK